MSRRGNQVDSFLRAFNAAYSTTRGVLKDREIRKIADAKPEESQGFTAEQGDDLRRAAESGQYDIAYDDQAKAYTVTPKSDPTQTGTIAQQGVTDFMGQRTAGPMSESKVSTARQMAMAGVLKKFGDVREGMAMENAARSAERDDMRFGREQKKWAQEDADAERVDQLRKIEEGVGSWMQQRLTNPDGSVREATPDDQLELGQYHASQLMKAGRVTEASALAKRNQEMALSKIQAESAQRNEDLLKVSGAVAAGDYSTLGAFYDRYVPDGAKIKGITQDPKTGKITIERTNIDGSALPPKVMESRDELMASIAALKDPQALYNYSQNQFRNNLALRAENRASAQFAQGQQDRQRKLDDETKTVEAAVSLFKEKNPNASPAEIEAVRRGVIPAVPKVDSNAPAEVKLAQAYMNAGLATDMASALKLATTTKGDSPEKVRADIYAKALTANFGDAAKAQEATEAAMGYLFPKAPAKAGPTAAKPKQGEVRDGYEYLGGDVNKKESWRAVSGGTVK